MTGRVASPAMSSLPPPGSSPLDAAHSRARGHFATLSDRHPIDRAKDFRPIRRQQGGDREARRSGRVANRGGKDRAEILAGHHLGSDRHHRRRDDGASRRRLHHRLFREPPSSGRSHRLPGATGSLALARLLRQHDDRRVLDLRLDDRWGNELRGARRHGRLLGADAAGAGRNPDRSTTDQGLLPGYAEPQRACHAVPSGFPDDSGRDGERRRALGMEL